MDHALTQMQSLAAKLVAIAELVEPSVTLRLQALASAVGGKLAGLDHRLKAVESCETKLSRRIDKMVAKGIAASEAAQRVESLYLTDSTVVVALRRAGRDYMFDVLRYTIVLPTESYKKWGVQEERFQVSGEPPSPPPRLMTIGAKSYELGRGLGRGVSGSVKLATDMVSREVVAIKELHKMTEVQMAELTLEMKLHTFAHGLASSTADCALVPAIHSRSENSLVLDFINGTTLKSYLGGFVGNQSVSPLPLDPEKMILQEKVSWIVVLKVVTLLRLGAHSKLSHRDLGTGNVMVSGSAHLSFAAIMLTYGSSTLVNQWPSSMARK